MIYEIYSKEKHLSQIRDLFLLQAGVWDDEQLPPNGIVAILNDTVVGAGFLRGAEGNVAYVDSYVTNPEFGSKERNNAISGISALLQLAASNMGYKKLFIITKYPSIRKRAAEFGFVELEGYTIQEAGLDDYARRKS